MAFLADSAFRFASRDPSKLAAAGAQLGMQVTEAGLTKAAALAVNVWQFWTDGPADSARGQHDCLLSLLVKDVGKSDQCLWSVRRGRDQRMWVSRNMLVEFFQSAVAVAPRSHQGGSQSILRQLRQIF
ncbi:hypothetical protein [Streptomyces sp. A30]|uniref:hypothetical protein n=1 Tax=Streptomyces sp. A30 TaxID=2789273 RepID=UPI0039811DDB